MPGIVTLKDLIDGTREHLASHPIPSSLSAGIDASTESVVLSSGAATGFVAQRGLLEVDDEVMLVVSFDTGTNTATVIRGYQKSTAAVHSGGATVLVHPSWGWTDRQIRYQHIQRAIQWLRPASWNLAVSENFTWPQGSYDVQLPTSAFATQPTGNQVYAVEVRDPQGNFKQFDGWQQIGPFLRFKEKASQAYTLHALLLAYQTMPQTLATPIQDDEFAEAIEFYAASLALNALKTNRVRFAEYSASLNDRASTPDELIRLAFDLKNQAVLAKEKATKPIPATYLKTYRPPVI